MALPPDIRQLIDAIVPVVNSDSTHQLRPILRKGIYEALAARPPAGLRARIWLDILTARRVTAVWATEVGDSRMDNLIALAEGVVRGAVDPQAARVDAGRMWEWLSNDYDERTEELSEQAFFALSTAIEAVFTATGLDRFEEVIIEEWDTDADLDPWCSDAASYAATTIAGSVWEPTSDAAKRRDFWMWWLVY